MRRIIVIGISIAIISVISGCAIFTPYKGKGSGVYIGEDRMKEELVIGKTTKEEVLEKFGPPTTIMKTNGNEAFIYEYKREGETKFDFLLGIGWKGEKIKTSMIFFDDKGVVKKYSYTEN